MTPGEDTAFRVWIRLLGRGLGSFTRADVDRALLDGENLYPRPTTPIARDSAHATLSDMVSCGELRFYGGRYEVVPRAPLPAPQAAAPVRELLPVAPAPVVSRGQMGFAFRGAP